MRSAILATSAATAARPPRTGRRVPDGPSVA